MAHKMPEFSTEKLLFLARLELETIYGQIGGKEQKRDGLHINNYPLVDVIRHHEKRLEWERKPCK